MDESVTYIPNGPLEVWREAKLRQESDRPTITMIDRWHDCMKQRLPAGVEVCIADRHCNKVLAGGPPGAVVNTALPMYLKNDLVLMVWLESPFRGEEVFWELVTHEVGHWVLFLSGFDLVDCQNQEAFWIRSNSVSLAHHAPLQMIQRECGHNPQAVFDWAAREKLNFFRRFDMQNQTEVSLVSRGLEFADSRLYASDEVRVEFENAARTEFSSIFARSSYIVELAERFDLHVASTNVEFQKKLYELLGFAEGLYDMNPATDMIAAAQSE